LGKIVRQALDRIEIQAWRGLHKYYKELEDVKQCPPVHWHLDPRNCQGQCLVGKKQWQPGHSVGIALMLIDVVVDAWRLARAGRCCALRNRIRVAFE